ncbi:MAG: type II toxin-antitoxin system prevent-host-death family antitoxin [Burkholderiales bacterium]|nr:MAG: type II toxin-antitoxin system prevent-host-death family antitoxin [Burkholderiales bacterium]
MKRKRLPLAFEYVGARDAKQRLANLLRRTVRGEQFIITCRGKPVARLVPFQRADAEAVRDALERVSRLRSRPRRSGVRLSDALTAGESARQIAHAGHRH